MNRHERRKAAAMRARKAAVVEDLDADQLRTANKIAAGRRVYLLRQPTADILQSQDPNDRLVAAMLFDRFTKGPALRCLVCQTPIIAGGEALPVIALRLLDISNGRQQIIQIACQRCQSDPAVMEIAMDAARLAFPEFHWDGANAQHISEPPSTLQ
ncbi:hypothetical protein LJ725_24305 [Reyranella aquatilis]|uniref:Uncharacterized protein n=1 Tax=Reyranella aquatilis TaxID=2035356 RepID=A0ABS8L1A4_9HYPH|nr:hypothetical protein [Reyranella aquatilis]MCC8432110.1 hypothetical protein [Reyranella aquatilis]